MNPMIHSQGGHYEDFICNAYRCYPNPRTGAYSGHYHAIYWSKHGYIKPSVTKYEKQIEKVRNYLEKAINKFLKRRLRQDERESLQILLSDLQIASNETELFAVVEKGLMLTKRIVEKEFKKR